MSSFLAGSLVFTPWGARPIEDLEPDDRVVSFDAANGRVNIGTVSRVFERTSDYYYRIAFANGRTLRVTERHPIYLGPDRGFREVRWLQRGDVVFGISDLSLSTDQLRPIPITLIERVSADVPVYNLEVVPFETYVVDGIGVHNKTLLPSVTPTRRPSVTPRMSPTPTPIPPTCVGFCLPNKESAFCLMFQSGGKTSFFVPMSCRYGDYNVCQQHGVYAACDGPSMPH